jgi:hypothetical protein
MPANPLQQFTDALGLGPGVQRELSTMGSTLAGAGLALPGLDLSPLAGGALNASSLQPNAAGSATGVAPTGAPTGGQVGGGVNVSAAPAISSPAAGVGAAGAGSPGLAAAMQGLTPAQQGQFQTNWGRLDAMPMAGQLDFWSQLMGGDPNDRMQRIVTAIQAGQGLI